MLLNKLRSFVVKYRIVSLRSKATNAIKAAAVVEEPAVKIKKLNYENKMLFGKVEKEKVDKKKKNVAVLPPETTDQKNDMTSEIYWLTQHQPVLDFTKKSKTPKPKKVKLEKCDSEEKVIKKKVLKKTIKKKIEQPEVHMPQSHLLDLPKPISVNIKSSLDNNFESKISTLFEVRPLLEVPFSAQHLKTMVNFPLTLGTTKNNKLLNSFKEIDDSVMIKMPSVSTILQATMPTTSRNALMQWKALKIAELGVDGFNKLQQC